MSEPRDHSEEPEQGAKASPGAPKETVQNGQNANSEMDAQSRKATISLKALIAKKPATAEGARSAEDAAEASDEPESDQPANNKPPITQPADEAYSPARAIEAISSVEWSVPNAVISTQSKLPALKPAQQNGEEVEVPKPILKPIPPKTVDQSKKNDQRRSSGAFDNLDEREFALESEPVERPENAAISNTKADGLTPPAVSEQSAPPVVAHAAGAAAPETAPKEQPAEPKFRTDKISNEAKAPRESPLARTAAGIPKEPEPRAEAKIEPSASRLRSLFSAEHPSEPSSAPKPEVDAKSASPIKRSDTLREPPESPPAPPQELEENLASSPSEAFNRTSLIGLNLANTYQIIDIIGEGRLCAVYVGMNLKTNVVFAVKSLKSEQQDLRDKFKAAAMRHGKLQHTNIVHSLACIVTPIGKPFFVMENLESVSLEEALQSSVRIEDPGTIASVLLQICSALEYAHQSGALHGRLTPNQILLVEKDGSLKLKVTDFGIADLQAVDSTDPNDAYDLLYLSPERRRGEPASIASDIYSLAVTAYRICSGRYPYEGKPGDPTGGALRPLSVMRPDLLEVEQLEALLQSVLDANSEWKIESAGQFKEFVEGWIDSVNAMEPEADEPDEPTPSPSPLDKLFSSDSIEARPYVDVQPVPLPLQSSEIQPVDFAEVGSSSEALAGLENAALRQHSDGASIDEAEVESSEPTTSTLLEAPVASIDQLTASAEPEAQADEDDSDVKSEPETGAVLDLTSEPETNAAPDLTTEPETNAAPNLTTEPETSAAPNLTTEPETSASTDPETEPEPAVSPEALQALTIAAASGSYKTLDSNSNTKQKLSALALSAEEHEAELRARSRLKSTPRTRENIKATSEELVALKQHMTDKEQRLVVQFAAAAAGSSPRRSPVSTVVRIVASIVFCVALVLVSITYISTHREQLEQMWINASRQLSLMLPSGKSAGGQSGQQNKTPQTNASQTNASQTNAPQTSAPQTNAPPSGK